MTRLQSPSGALSSLPFRLTILDTMIGLQWMPPEAKVAYASAIDSGLTSTVPSVKDGLSWYSFTMLTGFLPIWWPTSTPVFCAILVTPHMPAASSSWTK